MTKIKKSIAVLLAALMLISIAAVSASAATDTFTVNVSSNVGATASTEYRTAYDKTFTLTFNLKTPLAVNNCQGYLTYDSNSVRLTEFRLSDEFADQCFNTDNFNEVSFNSTSVDLPGDFSASTVLLTAEFEILGEGSTDIALTLSEVNTVSSDNKIVGIVSNGTVVDPSTTTVTAKLSDRFLNTSLTLKAAKSKIAYGASTKVTAKVTEGKGATTFTSSNKKVLTVDSKGNVRAKGVGTAKITAKNNGKSKAVSITVVKAANPMTVTAKKTVTANSKKDTTIKSVVTAKKAQGKVTYTTNNKKVTVKSGKLVVKKGLKKGKTVSVKITVKAAGTKNYKAASKAVTVKIKVK